MFYLSPPIKKKLTRKLTKTFVFILQHLFLKSTLRGLYNKVCGKISKKKYGGKDQIQKLEKEALPPWPEGKLVSQFH